MSTWPWKRPGPPGVAVAAPEADPPAHPASSARPTVSTEDTVLISLDEELLLQALEQLRPPQREVLTRRFLMELSVLETARHMERTEGAVKTLQFRALAKLRSEYLGVAA